MADITMCDHPNCRVAKYCKRSPVSGTWAGPNQSWAEFGERRPIEGGKGIWPINRCDHALPIHKAA